MALKPGIIGKPKIIELKPYDPSWVTIFEQEKPKIEKALGTNCVALYHFGSTAIPGLRAKPVIDIMAVVKNLSLIEIFALEQLSYEYRGEVVISGRYFSKLNPKIHLHIFEEKNPLIKQNLLFRDWLRTHDDDRDAYALLKEELAKLHTNGVSYSQAKTEFITTILKKSAENKAFLHENS